MKKRIMVIGPIDRDKEAIVTLIEGKKQQSPVGSMTYLDKSIRVPSSYLRAPGMMKHIIATQQNASAVIMVLSEQRSFPVYPPNFAKAFRIPTFGLILRRSTAPNDLAVRQAWQELEEAKLGHIQLLDLDDAQQCQEFLHTISLIEEGMI